MFGEYALYCDDKVVALICDEQLFIKPTAISSTFLQEDCLAAPYPGAKQYFRVPEEHWDDAPWFAVFIRQTADALPSLKPKI
jgi:TfoX/Sxy family transcriptional regulator of competence genes